MFYNVNYQDNIGVSIMKLSSNSTPFQVIPLYTIQVDSPLRVIDPFEIENICSVDAKHGKWKLESALFVEKNNKFSTLLKLWYVSCAHAILEQLESSPEHISLVKAIRAHESQSKSIQQLTIANESNPIVIKAIKIVTEFLKSHADDIKRYSSYYTQDSTAVMVLEQAVRQLGYFHSENSIMHDYQIAEYLKQPMDDDKINDKYITVIKPLNLKDLSKKVKLRQSILDDNFPRSVQYMRMKHADQASFTALDSESWELISECETSSGELAIILESYANKISKESIQITTSFACNNSETIDDEFVNVTPVGMFTEGMSCKTLYREHCLDVWVIRNSENEIVELMIHFDLTTDEEE